MIKTITNKLNSICCMGQRILLSSSINNSRSQHLKYKHLHCLSRTVRVKNSMDLCKGRLVLKQESSQINQITSRYPVFRCSLNSSNEGINNSILSKKVNSLVLKDTSFSPGILPICSTLNKSKIFHLLSYRQTLFNQTTKLCNKVMSHGTDKVIHRNPIQSPNQITHNFKIVANRILKSTIQKQKCKFFHQKLHFIHFFELLTIIYITQNYNC